MNNIIAWGLVENDMRWIIWNYCCKFFLEFSRKCSENLLVKFAILQFCLKLNKNLLLGVIDLFERVSSISARTPLWSSSVTPNLLHPALPLTPNHSPLPYWFFPRPFILSPPLSIPFHPDPALWEKFQNSWKCRSTSARPPGSPKSDNADLQLIKAVTLTTSHLKQSHWRLTCYICSYF